MGAVLVILLLMLTVYISINDKIEQGTKAGYFVFLLIAVVIMIIVKLV